MKLSSNYHFLFKVPLFALKIHFGQSISSCMYNSELWSQTYWYFIKLSSVFNFMVALWCHHYQVIFHFYRSVFAKLPRKRQVSCWYEQNLFDSSVSTNIKQIFRNTSHSFTFEFCLWCVTFMHIYESQNCRESSSFFLISLLYPHPIRNTEFLGGRLL